MPKNRFPQESNTAVDRKRGQYDSAACPEEEDKSEKPTVPPPRARTLAPSKRPSDAAESVKRSGVRASRSMPAATVDVVVADMSKDPRRERED
jgi:hypothetical protein